MNGDDTVLVDNSAFPRPIDELNMMMVDPIQAVVKIAETATSQGLSKGELVAQATGLQKQFKEWGININVEQTKSILAAIGLYSAWGMTKAYRKQVLIGIALFFIYANQEKFIGRKII
jgi:uncharacterized membrane protein (UPF0136 family)